MENKALEVLKMAILMERRGKEFYSTVAAQAKNENVKNIFSLMAKEEQLHIEQLAEQFQSYRKTGKFIETKQEFFEEDAIADMILNPEIIKNISASSFEAASISAAIDMENKAIEVYTSRAKETTNTHEKELYLWLSDFERSHLKVLNYLNKELIEKIWFDNKFWPF